MKLIIHSSSTILLTVSGSNRHTTWVRVGGASYQLCSKPMQRVSYAENAKAISHTVKKIVAAHSGP